MRIRFLRALIPALALAALPAISSAGVFIGVSVNLAPPPLPVYVQPPCPEPGYIWTPGYWAWNDDDDAYYWVPGTWVLPPQVGFLWTPGYWDWDDDVYVWHAGYWGPHVGFYGGVPYGYGYDGEGYEGGYWRGGVFFYNRAVVNVGPTFVTNVYYHPVVYRAAHEHVSYNGGPGGVVARPTREQVAFEHERHIGFTPVQQRQQRMAFADHALRADYNHGRPPIAATARPAVFHGNGAIAARAAGGPVHFAPARAVPSHAAAPMRSDRPAWATGQSHGGRPMERSAPMRSQPMERGAPTHEGAPMRAQPNFARPQQRFGNPPQQRYENAPQQRFDRPARPAPEYHQQFESRPQPQYHQQFEARPQPQYHQQFEARPQPQYHQQFEARPQPQYHQQFEARPQPQFQQQFRPQEPGPAMRGAPPREQPRGGGGGERPHGPPQDRHGGGH
jgi:hypothetical protein